MRMYPRQCGKSWLAEQAKEAALDAGATVVVARPGNITRQRRRKHLTLIEDVRPRSGGLVTIDDFPLPPNTV